MIRIQQLRLAPGHSEEELKAKIIKELKIMEDRLYKYKIVKKSIDARKKNDIKIIYAIDVKIREEKQYCKRLTNKNIMLTNDVEYKFVVSGNKSLHKPPVVVGSGPAGLFCALMLAENGYKPIVIERGEAVEQRVKDVNNFWQTGVLKNNSNVQFGEGGAGTFSDGKLNTLVKDESGRNKKVLDVFANFGAPSEIRYLNKPHIGTDHLRNVVKNMRSRIIELGGEVRFNTTLTNINIEADTVKSIVVNDNEIIECESLVLAIGHSARDTFKLINDLGLDMQSKAFAIGVRIEHPQELINTSQYGTDYDKNLPVADYKLTHKASNGRGVYSFCMCPGGFVVNSSSEPGGVVTNGMSNYKRNEVNANSAIIVNVFPEDYGTNDVLSGVEFQRKWERLAYDIAGSNYNIPVQLFEDFCNNTDSKKLGDVDTSISNYTLSNLRNCLPEYVSEALIEAINAFDKKIKGFARPDAVLSGVETRTSSPVRIVRDECYESNIKGIFPCGEGAGYAGGITSAAMDGIKIAEEIAKRYKPNL